MNRQRLLLFIVLLLLGGAIVWSYRAFPRQKTIPELVFKPGQQGHIDTSGKPASPLQQADDGTRLNLALLDQDVSGFKGYRRNIFKPLFVNEVKLARIKAVASKPVQQIQPVNPKPASVPPVETPVIQPDSDPLARFTFLGFLKKGAVKTIFLAKDKDIVLVKKGDVIAGRYEAADISEQALTLTVTDTGDEIIIPLVENRSLASMK